MTSDDPTTADVDSVRAELQRLGYLSHRVERFLLQDALRPQRPLRTLLLLASKLGVLGGALLALGGALLLLLWNPQLRAAPLDLPLLVLHLLPPSALAFGVAFLLLAGVLALVLRLLPTLRVESLSLAVGLLGGGAALVAALWRGRELLAPLPPLEATAVALLAAVAAYGLGRLLYQGLLALAIRLTDRAPRGRSHLRRYLLPGVLVVALALLAVPAMLAARRGPPPVSGFVPVAGGDRVLVIGVDGVLPAELDYLVRRGELPALGGLLARGGVLARYVRPAEPPAAFWTTIATGLDAPAHGIAAVDSFRPAGLDTALAVNGPFRWYWSAVERPLGLARHRPLLSNRRSAYTFWELLGRGGAPIVAVDWWGTYPAGATPGIVIAHGADQLLAESAPGAVAPTTRASELRALRDRARGEGDEPPVAIARAALAPADSARLLASALYPERFYRLAFAGAATRGGVEPRAAALYLPAIDIAAADWSGGPMPFAELLRAELTAADRLLAVLLADGDWGTVVVVVDPGRRGGGEGRALLWRRSGCGGAAGSATAEEQAATVERGGSAPGVAAVMPAVAPAAIGAALFRAAGLPQSDELPAPPAVCRWQAPPNVTATFGPRATEAAAARSDEYLQNLRALGYI